MWVVDSADRRRLEDCKRELHTLLVEEVGWSISLLRGDEREKMFHVGWGLGNNMLCMFPNIRKLKRGGAM